MKTKVITLCSSSYFYKELLSIGKDLEKIGFKVKYPYTATLMSKTEDFRAEKYRTWFTNPNDWAKKTKLMDKHLKKIASSDAILLINNNKNGQENYVGGNGLIEMAIAHFLKKKIYLWNPISKSSSFYEELVGLKPIIINQDLKKIK